MVNVKLFEDKQKEKWTGQKIFASYLSMPGHKKKTFRSSSRFFSEKVRKYYMLVTSVLSFFKTVFKFVSLKVVKMYDCEEMTEF